MQPWRGAVPSHPNTANCAWNWTDWSYWPEGSGPWEDMEEGGSGPGGGGGGCVLPDLSEKSAAGCFDAWHFTGKSDLMEAARPHQCQRSWWGPAALPCFI